MRHSLCPGLDSHCENAADDNQCRRASSQFAPKHDAAGAQIPGSAKTPVCDFRGANEITIGHSHLSRLARPDECGPRREKVSRFTTTSRFILSPRLRRRRECPSQNDNVTTANIENSPGVTAASGGASSKTRGMRGSRYIREEKKSGQEFISAYCSWAAKHPPGKP